jgi:putative Mg2+ transporter-C (MgtC) family protein
VDWLSPDLIETLNLGLLGRLALATLLGGAIGLERELSGKPAGLRTNILICVGAALLMNVSREVAAASGPEPADPARIAAQVVSGIGFIGAGTILLERGGVVGLTTAATLWVVAAIGLAVGMGAYVEAIGTTVLVAVTLVILGWLENLLFEQRSPSRVEIVLEPDENLLEQVVGLLKERGIKVRPLKVQKSAERYRISYELRGKKGRRAEAMNAVASLDGVRRVATD